MANTSQADADAAFSHNHNRNGPYLRRSLPCCMPGPEMLCVYQFKVVLRGISPMIWRRLLLRSDHSIADLHYTIQIPMGWSDSHLHRCHIQRASRSRGSSRMGHVC
jgi:Plasmid pRiA4b ORF-3-like protein